MHLERSPYELQKMQNELVYYLAATPCAQPAAKKSWFAEPAKQEQGNKPMNDFYETCATSKYAAAIATVTAPQSDVQDKIEYLRDRARSVARDLDEKLRKQFRLNEDGGPKSADDLIAAIKAGEFELDAKKVAKNKEYNDSYGYNCYGPMDVIKFTKFPGADKDGYKIAYSAMKAEYQKIKDIIQIKDADTALAAVQAFEGWTYDKPTVH